MSTRPLADMSLSRSWQQKEGGSRESWVAAANYARKCSELGGKWITFNTWTQRVEVLYVRSQYRTAFTNAWQLMTESQQKVPGPPLATAANAKDAPTPSTPEIVDETPKKEQQANKRRRLFPSDPAPSQGEAPQVKVTGKQVATILRKCALLKADLLVARGVQSSLFANIDGDATWGFASGMVGKLKGLRDSVHESHAKQKEFANLFMNSEPAVLKKRYDADSLYKNLVDFEANLKEPLAKLKEYQEKLRKMHGMYTC